MKNRTAILALVLAMGIPEAGAAQRPGPGPAGWGAGAGGLTPQALLRDRARLELTEEQVARLEEMAARSATAARETALAARSQRAQLAEALGAESVDLARVRVHFDSAQALESRLQWQRIEARVETAGLLTEAQRALLRDRAGRRAGRMGARRPAPGSRFRDRRFRMRAR